MDEVFSLDFALNDLSLSFFAFFVELVQAFQNIQIHFKILDLLIF